MHKPLVKDTAGQSLVAGYKHNGLGYRISVHEVADADGDMDNNDKWYQLAHDELQRIVATCKADSASAVLA